MVKSSSLPPGFRFSPTDVELVRFFLKRKVLGKKIPFEAIAEVDIYKYSPWDLPDKSYLKTGDLKWYFFCPRQKKYPGGARAKRSTHSGYWKTTGKDRPIHYNEVITGMVKSLVFHTGKPPKGNRTDWVMYEYRLEDKELADKGIVQDTHVICAVFKKDGLGPKNGAQYGAPFKEEDWDSDDEVTLREAGSSPAMPQPEEMLLANQNSSIITNLNVPNKVCGGSSVSGPSQPLLTAAYEPLSRVCGNEVTSMLADGENPDPPSVLDGHSASADISPILEGESEIEGLVNCFTDQCFPDSSVNNKLLDPLDDGIELLECADHGGNFEMNPFGNGLGWHNYSQGVNSLEWRGEAGGLTSNHHVQDKLLGGVGQSPYPHGPVNAYHTEPCRHNDIPIWPVDSFQADPYPNNAWQLHCFGDLWSLGGPTLNENQAFSYSKAGQANVDPTLVHQDAAPGSDDWDATSSNGPEAGTSHDWNTALSNRPETGAGPGAHDL